MMGKPSPKFFKRKKIYNYLQSIVKLKIQIIHHVYKIIHLKNKIFQQNQQNDEKQENEQYNKNSSSQQPEQNQNGQKESSQQTQQKMFEQDQSDNYKKSSTQKAQLNNNDNYPQNQNEIQTQKVISLQAQQQIQFYVYEDLNNLMEVLADVKQTLLHFNSQSDHPYIPIAVNRFIQQVNLSNLVHFDCTQRYKNKDEEYFYQKEKDNAQKLYKQLLQEMQLPNFKELEVCLSNYEQNFGQVNQFKQLELLETPNEGEFNQTVVQQVFTGIQHVDQKQSQIRKGQYKQLSLDQIKDNIKQRGIRAERLLKQNFPNDDKKNEQQA